MPIKFENKWGNRKMKQKKGKVPKGDLKANSRDREVSNVRGILHFMQEVSRVLKGRLLIEYVMVVG